MCPTRGPRLTRQLVSSLILAFFLLTASWAQTAAEKQQQIETHLRQAREFLQDDRTDLAARELSAVVALDPGNLEARSNLGVLLFFRGDFSQAAPQLRAALNLRPDLFRIQALLGMCEKRMGQADRAESDLRQSLPHLADEKLKVAAGLELIELYFAAGDLQKAAGVVSGLRELKPADPEILYTSYRIYSTLADEAMLGLLMSAPTSARAHQLMAHELARSSDAKGSIAQYRQALQLNPRLPGAHFELAEMLNSVSDPDAAQQEYRAALATQPYDERAECRLGEIALRANDLKQASSRFSRALQLQPHDTDASLGMARVKVAMNQPADAVPLLESAIKGEPYDPALRYRLAAVYRALGRTEDAHREFAEFQRLTEMKEKLDRIFAEMRVQLKVGPPDSTAAK